MEQSVAGGELRHHVGLSSCRGKTWPSIPQVKQREQLPRAPEGMVAGCWSPPDAGTEVSAGCVELGASPAVTSLCRCVRGGPDVLNFSAINSRLLASSNLAFNTSSVRNPVTN